MQLQVDAILIRNLSKIPALPCYVELKRGCVCRNYRSYPQCLLGNAEVTLLRAPSRRVIGDLWTLRTLWQVCGAVLTKRNPLQLEEPLHRHSFWVKTMLLYSRSFPSLPSTLTVGVGHKYESNSGKSRNTIPNNSTSKGLIAIRLIIPRNCYVKCAGRVFSFIIGRSCVTPPKPYYPCFNFPVRLLNPFLRFPLSLFPLPSHPLRFHFERHDDGLITGVLIKRPQYARIQTNLDQSL